LSTALFFNLGARIYRWTGSEEVADYVTMAYSWLDERGLIDSKTGAVYDGARVDDNCTTINKFQWSVNAASLSMGLAYLYNTVSSCASILNVQY
jgi:mannan endo-1,6-alpha-mannosidase